jgi:hypothetical protein
MRAHEPFESDDLAELDELLLARAEAVVAMREVAAGRRDPLVIGMRHDVDNVFPPALEIARWEAARGYRSTFFIRHDAPYWDDERELQSGLEEIAALGHEIGIHTNALTVALLTGRDPDEILAEAIARLRGWGHDVRGVVSHGDSLCYRARYVNDEQFEECARPEMGPASRTLRHMDVAVVIRPRPLSDFGLEYESYRLGRANYLSDSGGQWSTPGFPRTCYEFPSPRGQLHILQHPDWWGAAFPAPTA